MPLKNILTAIRTPSLAIEYVGWRAKKLFGKESPTRMLGGGVVVGDFVNFSEYHSVKGFVLEDELAFWTTYPFSEGSIIDIGANIGVVSILLAKRFANETVHAVEPNPATLEALTSNLRRNKLTNVKVHKVAVSDKDGTVHFNADGIDRGRASIVLESGENVVNVPCTKLDTLVRTNNISAVSILKVDVEGFEYSVFKGAHELLTSKQAPLVYFEVCPSLSISRGFAPDAAGLLLREYGYRLYSILPGGRLEEKRSESGQPDYENLIARKS
jgi:FkbM family methyltransferase